MQTFVTLLAAFVAFSSAIDIELVNFGGNGNKKWRETNDPVMGGESHGSFSVGGGLLHWRGEVVDVPKLSAPGFIKVQTDAPGWFQRGFPDISSCKSLYIKARTGIAYDGYRLSFGTKRDLSCSFFSGGFKTRFDVPVSKETFGRIEIPLTDFSNCNSDSTGEPVKTCADHPNACPDGGTLKDVKVIALWAEGVGGVVDLEVQAIGATGCDDIDQQPLGVTGRHIRRLFTARRMDAPDATSGVCTKSGDTPAFRVDEGRCSQTCLSKYLGFCPRKILIKNGGLTEGNCKDQGYTEVAVEFGSEGTGKSSQKAGPCGTLDFMTYDNSDPLIGVGEQS